LAGCGLFFRCFLVLLCSSASVGLGFGVSLVVSVGFSRLGLWVPLGFGVVGVFFWGRFGFCGCWCVLLFLGMFLGFGFVSAPRILPVYWGAFRFFNKIAYYLSKKKFSLHPQWLPKTNIFAEKSPHNSCVQNLNGIL